MQAGIQHKYFPSLVIVFIKPLTKRKLKESIVSLIKDKRAHMNLKKREKVIYAYAAIQEIIQKALELEKKYEGLINNVQINYQQSARNLVHYLAFRSFDSTSLQKNLHYLGFNSLTSVEDHILFSLVSIKTILEEILQIEKSPGVLKTVSPRKSKKLLLKNTKLLFGYKSKNRTTRIMVTLPEIAANNPVYVKKLILAGMNCARINCAHYDEAKWQKMITNIRTASESVGKKCRIAMDLAGPKLRTGAMVQGPKIIHIKPHRDDRGRVVKAARLWIAPEGIDAPPHSDCDATIPVKIDFFEKIKREDIIILEDSRGKKVDFKIIRKENGGKWALCDQSVYLETGATIRIKNQSVKSKEDIISTVGELLPKEQYLKLFIGDHLVLHADPMPGEPASNNTEEIKVAHISCTLPEAIKQLSIGDPIFFNDGKIEGKVIQTGEKEATIRITHARQKGSRLRADKGINLPESQIEIHGLTKKDKKDLAFVTEKADVINMSFINSKEDVQALIDALNHSGSEAGIILKIETKEGYKNLPSILLKAMENYPVGVMIARGDLAIETGWKNFAIIQEEILQLCDATHLPAIWATQVLENLAKKGIPTRAEITDIAMSQRADCVMLNKGPYIVKAVRMLDKVLRKMQRIQKGKVTILPKLEFSEDLQ